MSCSGDAQCPQDFTTTDNTTRSYIITNLTPLTNYMFSVVATNSIGSINEDCPLNYTTKGKITVFICTENKLLYIGNVWQG